jgi:hypothetical protein
MAADMSGVAARFPSAITRDTMFVPLLAADPTFEPVWQEFLADYADELELPLYMALMDLAIHLIAQLARGDTSRFALVFNGVEQWHLRGNEYVREAATIGLLEDLQNENFHGQTRPAEIQPWLGPETQRWWTKVERFWSEGELITDD